MTGPTNRNRHAAAAALLAVAAVATLSTPVQAATCPWPEPGANPYRGSVAAALVRLRLPPEVRIVLQADMAHQINFRRVTITRDRITFDDGPPGELTGHQNMNFAGGAICWGDVDRSAWPESRRLPALAYRYRGYYVLYHPGCGNVSEATNLADRPQDYPAGVRARFTAQSPQPVPEPSTSALVLLALAAIAAVRWRGRRNPPKATT